jgi:hypothetical protein
MSLDATNTALKQSFDYYMGPLNIDPGQDFLGASDEWATETQSYEYFPPAFHWLTGTSVPVVVTNREFGTLSTGEPGHVLRAFITGVQVVSGASAASDLVDRVMAIGADAVGGTLTLIPLTADDAPVRERTRQITGARALVDARLDALSCLSEGWLDGEGVAPTPTAVSVARDLIWILLNHGATRPRVAPTPEGGIEAEWTAGDREVSVTFEPDGSLYGNAVDAATGEITEPELNPANHQAVADFVLGRS